MTDWNSIRALVTGASRGLGFALSQGLRKRGARVAMVARTSGPLEEAAKQIGGHAIVADVGAPNAATLIAARARELMGGVDLLIHNASVLGPIPLQQLADTAPDQFREVFEVNVFGPQRLTNALLGAMRKDNHGTIAVISSDAAIDAYPTWGVYGASKAALDHLIRIQAAELDGTGIKLAAFDPGEMNTQMHAEALPDADPATLREPQEVAEQLLSRLGAVENGQRIRLAEVSEC